MRHNQQTVIIAGGGPVGLALACLLADAPGQARRRIVVVDTGSAPQWTEAELDARVYALSRASQHLLAAIGVWDSIVGRRASPYRKMKIWEHSDDSTAQASLEFDCAEIGEPNLGHIVEDGLLRVALHERLTECRGVESRWHQRVERVAITANHVDVTIDDETIAAALLIGADGGRSVVRDLVGVGIVERDYAQKALVTHVCSERPHRATAWQRFLPGGPLALLPLADGRSSIVWSLPTAQAERLQDAAERVFLDELQRASDDVLGALSAASQRVAFELSARHAWRYCEHRVALVGDAAHTVHPLAGLGMNLGLLDAMSLGRVFDAAMRADEDPGDLRVLRRYERDRKGDNLATLLALDGLDRLFRLPPVLAPARRLGLDLVDHMPPAKRFLMHSALGLAHVGTSRS